MKRHEALPGKYLAKEDFEPPRVAEVSSVVIESVEGEHGSEDKAVLYIDDERRGIILNGTNWDMIEALAGEADSDNWKGTKIEIFHDPTVKFGKRMVGGIRVRAPGSTSAPDSGEAF